MTTEPDSAILELMEAYKTTIFAKDAEGFVALFDPDVRSFDLWAAWSYDGIDPWRKMVGEWFGALNADRDAVSFDEIKMIVSGDLAVVTGFVRFAAVTAEGKELRSMEERLTLALVKKHGGWKIAHQHTSGPIDFNTMKVMLQRE
jgi:uncharacterized protein (TIGR02246 family)